MNGTFAMNYRLVLAQKEAAYLDSCARIRGISTNALLTRLVEVICKDQLVLSILDDDSEPGTRPNERGYSESRRIRRQKVRS